MNISRIIFTVLLLQFSLIASATDLSIVLTNCARIDSIQLLSYYGEKTTLIETVGHSESCEFIFKNSDKLPVGLYQINIPEITTLDIILNSEDVTITFDPYNISQSLRIATSEENRIFYGFKSNYFEIEQGLRALSSALQEYPTSRPFYVDLCQQFMALQYERKALIDSITTTFPETYASLLIGLYRSPIIEATDTHEQQLEQLKDEFFFGLDFSNPALLNSNGYTNKVLEYMVICSNKDFSFEEFQQAMTVVVDRTLAVSSQNQQVFDMMLEFLVDGFEAYHMDEVLAYISENWAENCSDSNSENRLKKRLENYQKLTYGKVAPDFNLPTSDGEMYHLYADKTPYVLIYFYASGCSHCREMLPKIKNWYLKNGVGKVQVVAISIDEKADEWKQFITEEEFPWVNIHEPKIWDGEAASAYSIYATPTIFLLNSDREIIAKPITFSGLKDQLKHNDLW